MNKLLVQAPRFGQTAVRRLSLWRVKDSKADIRNIKKKQLEYQMNESVPIYLRGGKFDYFLYYTTVGLTFVGVGMSFKAIYQLASGK